MDEYEDGEIIKKYALTEADMASDEGIWLIVSDKPIPTNISVAMQIDMFYQHFKLHSCNAAMARMYGYESPDQLVGAMLADMLPPNNENLEYLRNIISNGYKIENALSKELDAEGRTIYFFNTLECIVHNDHLILALGRQKQTILNQ